MQNTEKLNQIKFYRKFYVREKNKVEYNSECEADQAKRRDYRPIKWTNNATNESIVMYYDYRGRRCGKLFYNSDGVWQSSVKFFYNNFTLIQESTAANIITKEFVWDPSEPVATRPLAMKCNVQNLNLLYTHDANKNVTEVLYLATINGLAAHYEYSPFGELRDFSYLSTTQETSNSETNAITETSNSEVNTITEMSNSEVNAIAETLNSANASPGDFIGWRDTPITEIDIRTFNPFRFFSEYHDDELNLIYYNYRHYDPTTARWLSREPLEEYGSINLYAMCFNDVINFFDWLGLKKLTLIYNMSDKLVNTTYAISWDDLSSLVKRDVVKFHPEGKDPCNCIKKISIIAHGDKGEILNNPPDTLYGLDIAISINDIGVVDLMDRFNLEYEKLDENLKDAVNQVNNFSQNAGDIGNFLCNDGIVEIRACRSFRGKEGEQFKDRLKKFFKIRGERNIIGYQRVIKQFPWANIFYQRPFNKNFF